VDSGFDENETELNSLARTIKIFEGFLAYLGVLVLLIALEMLADRNSLLNKHVPMKFH